MKAVLKLDLHDERMKQKALMIASTVPGVDSVAIDMKEEKLTVIGEVDPVIIVKKLRKICYTDIVTVGPAKEPEPKKPPAPPKPNPPPPPGVVTIPLMPPPYHRFANGRCSFEEDPNGCVIC